jgi:hypothetical protein
MKCGEFSCRYGIGMGVVRNDPFVRSVVRSDIRAIVNGCASKPWNGIGEADAHSGIGATRRSKVPVSWHLGGIHGAHEVVS